MKYFWKAKLPSGWYYILLYTYNDKLQFDDLCYMVSMFSY